MEGNVVLTLSLETREPGVIPLDTVVALFAHFQQLIEAIGREIAPELPISWGISSLALGSVSAKVVPLHANPAGEYVEHRIAKALDDVAAYAQSGNLALMPFGSSIREETAAMLRSLNDEAPAFSMSGTGKVFRLTRREAVSVENRGITWGTVRGTVEALNEHRIPCFILYDEVFDNPIQCELREGVSPLSLLDLWKKRIEVTGLITANPETGVVKSIQEIEEIKILESFNADYKRTEGIWRDWESTADDRLEALRRIRRAE